MVPCIYSAMVVARDEVRHREKDLPWQAMYQSMAQQAWAGDQRTKLSRSEQGHASGSWWLHLGNQTVQESMFQQPTTPGPVN